VLFDAHTHLQPHGEQPPVDRARIALYVETALANGLDGLVITEHLFRFREAYDLLAGWWDADPNPRLAAVTATYWRDHVNLSLPAYVALIEAAKTEGLPVRLGLELDYIPGRADDLRALLAPYAWDMVLGSVHWLGAFGIDDDPFLDEWAQRDVDAVHAEYGDLLEQLAASGLADVLAHSDLPKIWGFKAGDPALLEGRIVAAAQSAGMAIELNTNGWNKPVGEQYPSVTVLRSARTAGVPITLASDAHRPHRLGEGFQRAIALAQAAGHDGYVRFERRQRLHEPFALPNPRPLS
jgi:histidinol-phosphatase (PHP family)